MVLKLPGRIMQLSQAVQAAAVSLQQISDATSGERARRAATVALVLRCVRERMEGAGEESFVLRRAAAEVEALPASGERALLKRLLLLVEETGAEGEAPRLAATLVGYGCELEATRRLPEADAVLALARTAAPRSAEVAMHAGRVARKQGDRERALSLYRAARELAGGSAVARMAAIGEAVISEGVERRLSVLAREAVRAGDGEAAGVALEERARARREAGARGAAVRDLCVAAFRFGDPVDRARVAHQIADVCIAADDPRAAREALLVALVLGDGTQREHARGRLHTVSRDLSDEVGMRRWRSFSPPALVSLSARPRAQAARSAAPMLARWRRRAGLEPAAAGEGAVTPLPCAGA